MVDLFTSPFLFSILTFSISLFFFSHLVRLDMQHRLIVSESILLWTLLLPVVRHSSSGGFIDSLPFDPLLFGVSTPAVDASDRYTTASTSIVTVSLFFYLRSMNMYLYIDDDVCTS